MREDVLASATKFLQDPKVQSAALAKKVSFLESKGLTSDEIEEALSRSSGKKTATAGSNAMAVPGGNDPPRPTPPPGYYYPQHYAEQLPPPRPPLDWKDYFIAAVAFGGVSYGMYALTKKYMKPLLSWPTQEDVQNDNQRLDEQFKVTAESLASVKEETEKILKTISEQNRTATETILTLESSMEEMIKADATRDEDFKAMKLEFENIKSGIPNMVNRNKEAQTAVLNDLQSEVKSLKSLMLNRRAIPAISQPATTEESLTSMPPDSVEGSQQPARLPLMFAAKRAHSIPSWQLASQKTTAAPTDIASTENGELNAIKVEGAETNAAEDI